MQRHQVTDTSISSNKKGAGILIRKVRRAKPETGIATSKKPPTRLGTDPSAAPTNEEATAGESSDSASSSTHDSQHTEDSTQEPSIGETPLRPRPGDLCVIQYRCYVLQESSPSASTSTRNPARVHKRLVAYTSGFVKDDDNDDEANEIPIDETTARAMLNLQRGVPRPPLEFEVGAGNVIRGLEAAVQCMVPCNSKDGDDDVLFYEVTIPYLYAYGAKGHLPDIQPRADLMFDVKLIEVQRKKRTSKGGFRYKVVLAIRQSFLYALSFLWPWNALPAANNASNNNDANG